MWDLWILKLWFWHLSTSIARRSRNTAKTWRNAQDRNALHGRLWLAYMERVPWRQRDSQGPLLTSRVQDAVDFSCPMWRKARDGWISLLLLTSLVPPPRSLFSFSGNDSPKLGSNIVPRDSPWLWKVHVPSFQQRTWQPMNLDSVDQEKTPSLKNRSNNLSVSWISSPYMRLHKCLLYTLGRSCYS